MPERTTDFIFAVFAEEFGLVGEGVLLLVYMAADRPRPDDRSHRRAILLAPARRCVSLIFFTYAFVNMGMVTGILPVVGVPLPLMSYGGTAAVTLGLGAGILMSIRRSESLMQT